MWSYYVAVGLALPFLDRLRLLLGFLRVDWSLEHCHAGSEKAKPNTKSSAFHADTSSCLFIRPASCARVSLPFFRKVGLSS